MADSRRVVRQQAAAIDNLPYGVARTSAAEALARRVEAEGPEDLLPSVLLDLLEAHTFGQTPERSFATFAHLMRLWDAHPESFSNFDTRRLFWGFKWVAGDLPDLPQISRSQAEEFLDDMEQRFAVAGRSHAAVLGARFRWLWHAGRPEAEAARIAWVQAEQDDLDDCEACIVGQQVDYLTEMGEYAAAVALGAQQSGSCNLEPTRTLYALALAQLMTGDAAGAAHSHRKGRGSLRLEDSDFAPARGQEFELLARGGHFDKAMHRLREEHAGLLLKASTPLFRLRFLVAVLAGLAANRGDAEVATRLDLLDAPTVADLLAWVEREARVLAAQFDQRGDTDYYHRLIERALTARRSTEVLPLDPPTPASEAPDGGGERATPSPQDQAIVPAAAAAERAEALAGVGRYAEAAELYELQAASARDSGLLAEAGLAFAEAAHCRELAEDMGPAHALYSSALPLLVAGSAAPDLLAPVAVAWAPVAVRVADATGVLAALETALEAIEETDMSALSEDLRERRRGELTGLRAASLDAWARTVASLPSSARGEGSQLEDAARAATDAAEAFAQVGKLYDAAHGFWLAGRLQREVGEIESGIWSLESACEGLALAGRTAERAEVAGELIQMLQSVGQHHRAAEVVESLMEG